VSGETFNSSRWRRLNPIDLIGMDLIVIDLIVIDRISPIV
jgi:hypothetical protein